MKTSLLMLVVSLLLVGCASEERAIRRQAMINDNCIVSDWIVGEYRATPEVLHGLGISPTSSRTQIRMALKRFGVDIGPDGKACMFRGGTVLLVGAHQEEQYQIHGIVLLLQNGFKIHR